MGRDDILSNRFDRLRHIVFLRQMKLESLEKQAIHWFEKGNLAKIEELMKRRETILAGNEQLSSFIAKWEKEDAVLARDQLFTTI